MKLIELIKIAKEKDLRLKDVSFDFNPNENSTMDFSKIDKYKESLNKKEPIVSESNNNTKKV